MCIHLVVKFKCVSRQLVVCLMIVQTKSSIENYQSPMLWVCSCTHSSSEAKCSTFLTSLMKRQPVCVLISCHLLSILSQVTDK